MCTLIVIRAPGLSHPTVVAANRDERLDRETRRFGRHWPGPWQAGLDVLAGGTWAGVHDAGFGLFMLNQMHALGPAPDKRSRGLLALDLLESGSFDSAVSRARELRTDDYRPFHLVVAAARGVTGFSTAGAGFVDQEMAPGVSIWTAEGVNRSDAPRQVAHRAPLEAAHRDWVTGDDVERLLDRLEGIMARGAPAGGSPADGLCIRWPEHNFGTRSSLLIAFPHAGDAPLRLRLAEGPPDETRYERLEVP